MSIGVIGAGRLGLCFSLLAAQAGYKVHISDKRSDHLCSIKNKSIKSNEPDVERMLTECNLVVHDNNKNLISACDIIFTFVATPSLDNGRYDLKAIHSVLTDFKTSKYDGAKTLVIGSTVNPGDCDKIAQSIPDDKLRVIYNPEFIAQGSVVKDLRHSNLVLIGSRLHDNDPAIVLLKELYLKIQSGYANPSIRILSPPAAELVKLSINCFLTTKISYANMIGTIFIKSGLGDEINDALSSIALHPPIGSSYLNFGFGYGGPCLPRDNRALAAYSQTVGVPHSLGTVSDEINNAHNKILCEYLESQNTSNLPFFFDTVTYKPGTDILEESAQLALLELLLSRGHSVYVYDIPCVLQVISERLSRLYPRRFWTLESNTQPSNSFKVVF